MPFLQTSGAWALVPGGIYFIPDNEPESLFYFDFASTKAKRVARLGEHVGMGLSVSPDRTWMAFSDYAETASNIMFLDRLP
jgi:hypothetical protein